ncbi:unnamed protein product [Nezara viridula]|uniref:Uncharacterized protein n=1 Tax=Nezara viridula TaxID=85310 RepID=A0A9P0HAA9_NEZVI|nr:unnamed protein product [Nezara viridula]
MKLQRDYCNLEHTFQFDFENVSLVNLINIHDVKALRIYLILVELYLNMRIDTFRNKDALSDRLPDNLISG